MKRIKLKRFDGMVKEYPEPMAKILVRSARFKYLRSPKESNKQQKKK